MNEDRDMFEQMVDAEGVLCPEHSKPMKGKRVEVRTGLHREFIRKIMYIGKCPENGCNKWFEYTPMSRMVMWP